MGRCNTSVHSILSQSLLLVPLLHAVTLVELEVQTIYENACQTESGARREQERDEIVQEVATAAFPLICEL